MIPILRIFWLDCQIAYHELALAHLTATQPTTDAIPEIVLTIRQLSDQRDAIVRAHPYAR